MTKTAVAAMLCTAAIVALFLSVPAAHADPPPNLPGGDSQSSSTTSNTDKQANADARQRALDAAKPPQSNGRLAPQTAGAVPVITLGFDDGRASQADAAAVLTANGLDGTFYLISGDLNQPYFLTTAQALAMETNGNEIGGHTRTHPNLVGLSTADQTTEICGGRTDLINAGFTPPISFAYPYGSYNASAEAVAQSCGFTNARSTDAGLDVIPPAVPYATAVGGYVTTPGPSLADMQGWVTSAEASGTPWTQLLWHDITSSTQPGWGDIYQQDIGTFTTFVTWLKGEVDAGRVTVQTAGQVVPSSEVIAPYGAIGGLWSSLGFLGTPVDNEYDVVGFPGARREDFTNGQIYWSEATDVNEVHGGILGSYALHGGATVDGCGLPLTSESVSADGVGRFNHFQNCDIFWSPTTDVHALYGGVRVTWTAEGGFLGDPITDEVDTAGGGRSQTFQDGMIYWSPSSDAHEVHGAILTAWAAQGSEAGPLGYPITDEFDAQGGRESDFQGGTITWTDSGGAVVHLTVTP